MSKITYTDKVSVASSGSPTINTWRDNDANEVKSVVNANDTVSTSTSNTVLFDKVQGYRHGTWATPIVGIIALNTAGAVEGGCAVVIWNGSTSPTFSGGTIQSYSGNITESGTYSVYIHYLNGRFNVNVFNVEGSTAPIELGKKLVFTQADAQYAIGTGASIPNSPFTIEVDMVTDIGTNNLITYSGLKFTRLNATEIYIGVSSGFDIYPLTIAEMVGKNIKATWDDSDFSTSLLVDDVAVTLDRTQGTKGTAVGVASIGLFVTQTGGDVAIKGLKFIDGVTVENDYDFDPATEITTLVDKVGTQDMTITVGTGTIEDMWVDL